MEPTYNYKMTKSLLSGSEKPQWSRSESEGGSCGTAPYSKPYMLRSATDAASAAIDYSKGNVEDGVVDSPPKRGPARTTLCSPSPLKRESPSRGRSLSPNPGANSLTVRKLNLSVQEALRNPRLEVAPQLLAVVGIVHASEMNSANAVHSPHKEYKDNSVGVAISGILPEQHNKRPRSSYSVGALPRSPVDNLSRPHDLIDRSRILDANSIGSRLPLPDNLKPMLPRLPPRGTKSLLTCEVPEYTRMSKRNGSRSQSLCNVSLSGSGRHYPSRRDDIFRGLAKLRAAEAAEATKRDRAAGKDV